MQKLIKNTKKYKKKTKRINKTNKILKYQKGGASLERPQPPSQQSIENMNTEACGQQDMELQLFYDGKYCSFKWDTMHDRIDWFERVVSAINEDEYMRAVRGWTTDENQKSFIDLLESKYVLEKKKSCILWLCIERIYRSGRNFNRKLF
jgi:hypothetical protein